MNLGNMSIGFETESPTKTTMATSASPVPGRPCRLSARAIQSPYIHRANGLLQIALSTLLRIPSFGGGCVSACEALSIRH
jgi:hypothetical protein